MSNRQKKPDARALFKQAKSRSGQSPAQKGGAASKSSSAELGGKYRGKSKDEVREIGTETGQRRTERNISLGTCMTRQKGLKPNKRSGRCVSVGGVSDASGVYRTLYLHWHNLRTW